MYTLAQAPPGVFWICALLAIGFAIAAFFGTFWLLNRARLIEDTPMSHLRSAAQGYVQIEGNARLMPGPEIISPISQQRCVWWRYSVEERQDRSDGRMEWVTIESDSSDDLFLLVDTTGECIIDPHGAHIQPTIDRSWRGFTARPLAFPQRSPYFSFGSYRYHEKFIAIGERLFATGWFRTQTAYTEFDDASEVGELLAEWKRDRQELLRRFDSNHDGQIDMQEWEAVRRAALDQVRAQQVERSADPNLNVLSAPPNQLPFVLSTAPQNVVAQHLKWVAASCLVVSTLACGLAIHLLHLRGLL